MDCDALKPFLSLAARSIREEDLKLLTGEAAMRMWEDVADNLCDGVEKFTLMHENDHPVFLGVISATTGDGVRRGPRGARRRRGRGGLPGPL